jgi:hypothetical protein
MGDVFCNSCRYGKAGTFLAGGALIFIKKKLGQMICLVIYYQDIFF